MFTCMFVCLFSSLRYMLIHQTSQTNRHWLSFREYVCCKFNAFFKFKSDDAGGTSNNTYFATSFRFWMGWIMWFWLRTTGHRDWREIIESRQARSHHHSFMLILLQLLTSWTVPILWNVSWSLDYLRIVESWHFKLFYENRFRVKKSNSKILPESLLPVVS